MNPGLVLAVALVILSNGGAALWWRRNLNAPVGPADFPGAGPTGGAPPYVPTLR